MSEVEENTDARPRYRVVSVKKTTKPEGMQGKNWCCYVIQRGSSVMTGKKPGTIKAVTEHAERIASDLNARSAGGAGSPNRRKGK